MRLTQMSLGSGSLRSRPTMADSTSLFFAGVNEERGVSANEEIEVSAKEGAHV